MKFEIKDIEVISKEEFKATENSNIFIKDNGDAAFIDNDKCLVVRAEKD